MNFVHARRHLFACLSTWPEVIKLFSCSIQPSVKFSLQIKFKLLTFAIFVMLNIAEHENFSANMKMPTIVGIFIFISRENFMLRCVEHEKSFITLGPYWCRIHF